MGLLESHLALPVTSLEGVGPLLIQTTTLQLEVCPF